MNIINLMYNFEKLKVKCYTMYKLEINLNVRFGTATSSPSLKSDIAHKTNSWGPP